MMGKRDTCPNLVISPRRLTVGLLSIAVVLVVIHLVCQAILQVNNYAVEGFWGEIISRFDLDAEMSVPTWFSQILLLLAAVLAGYIAVAEFAARGAYRYHWAGLGGLLLYASIDEGASLHETLGYLEVTQVLGINNSFFRFGWVVLGIAIVLVLGMVFLRFWWRLPSRTRVLLAVGAIVYVAGSLGVEMISSNFLESNEWNSFIYRGVLVALEEGMEMLGAIVVIHGFAQYIQTRKLRVNISIQ